MREEEREGPKAGTTAASDSTRAGPPSRLSAGPEFDRIRQIVARLGGAAGPGIGDDCALIPEGPGALLASCDLSVEGVHFRADWLTLEEIGWRAAAAALSDLAAAGAQAVGALVSLGVPSGAAEDAPARVMAGVGDALAEAGGIVLGGDLSRSPQWLIDLTVLGRAERPVRRTGARPGDGLWVSGRLGGARAALSAWQRGEAPPARARAAFAHPVPRLALGGRLARAGATAMLDLSDGLGGDARHLAAASGVSLVIELDRLPLHEDVPPMASLAGMSAAEFGALGGEDYELLAALPPEFGTAEASTVAAATGLGLRRIGTVGQGGGVEFRLGGRTLHLAGYDHFR